MKKKQKILVLAGICAINLLSWEAQAMYHEQVSVIETGDNLPTGYEKILLYSDDSIYQWNTTAARELERILNLIENHEGIIIDSMGTTHNYYIPTRNHTFDYTNTNSDPYHSGFYNDSRVFVKRNPATNYVLDFFDMVYCLDSYLGLANDYISNYSNEHPICWKVNPLISQSYNQLLRYHFHQLYVEYGYPASENPNPYN